MKILYISDDGTLFDNEKDCYEYELKVKYFDITYITVYYKNDERPHSIAFNDVFSDTHYQRSEVIIVYNEKQLEALKQIADYCGWVEWSTDIDSPGTWERKEINWYKGKWIKK